MSCNNQRDDDTLMTHGMTNAILTTLMTSGDYLWQLWWTGDSPKNYMTMSENIWWLQLVIFVAMVKICLSCWGHRYCHVLEGTPFMVGNNTYVPSYPCMCEQCFAWIDIWMYVGMYVCKMHCWTSSLSYFIALLLCHVSTIMLYLFSCLPLNVIFLLSLLVLVTVVSYCPSSWSPQHYVCIISY